MLLAKETREAVADWHLRRDDGTIDLCMASRKQIAEYRLTDHARQEMRRRQISEDDVANVLAAPEQWETVREGREVFQSRGRSGDPPRTCLLRVFVDTDREPPAVVTAYRTSRITKYWRNRS